MYDSVIKFICRSTDLDRTDEFWQCDTVDVRWNDIMDNIVKVTGLSASKNMQPLREGVFQVNKDTTIENLKGLALNIRQWYKIDCFQISIDRSTDTAHMLFDFNDRETAKSIVINRSQHIALSVMILRYLHLPRPEGSEQWLAYFLKDRFNDNPDAFATLLDKLKHAKLGKESFNLASDVLNYVQQMCQGILK